MSTSPNVNSVLKPPKQRIPLKDIMVVTQDEDTTSIPKRRVSFANVNKVKEFSAVAESMVVCHTPAYEEPFSMSSDSSYPSGIDGSTPAKSNPLGPEMLQEIYQSEQINVCSIVTNENLLEGISPVDGISQNFLRVSSDMELTHVVNRTTDIKLFSNNTVKTDDTGALDMTEAVNAPRMSVGPLYPNSATYLSDDFSSNHTRYSVQGMDLTRPISAKKPSSRRQSTRYSMSAMEMTEVIDNAVMTGLDLTEDVAKTRLSTNYSVKDMDTDTSEVNMGYTRMSTNSMECTEMFGGNMDYSADSEASMEFTKPIQNICPSTPLTYTQGIPTVMSTGKQLNVAEDDGEQLAMNLTRGILSDDANLSCVLAQSPNPMMNEAEVEKSVGRVMTGTGPEGLNFSKRTENQSPTHGNRSQFGPDDILPSLVNKNIAHFNSLSKISSPKSPLRYDGKNGDVNLSSSRQNKDVECLSTSTPISEYNVNDQSRTHQKSKMVEPTGTESTLRSSDKSQSSGNLNRTSNNQLEHIENPLASNLKESSNKTVNVVENHAPEFPPIEQAGEKDILAQCTSQDKNSHINSRLIHLENDSLNMDVSNDVAHIINPPSKTSPMVSKDHNLDENAPVLENLPNKTYNVLENLPNKTYNILENLPNKTYNVLENSNSRETLCQTQNAEDLIAEGSSFRGCEKKVNSFAIQGNKEDYVEEEMDILMTETVPRDESFNQLATGTCNDSKDTQPVILELENGVQQEPNNEHFEMAGNHMDNSNEHFEMSVSHMDNQNKNTQENTETEELSNTTGTSHALIDMSNKINNITFTRGSKSFIDEHNLTAETSYTVENTDHVMKYESLPLIERMARMEKAATLNVDSKDAHGRKRSFEEALRQENNTEESPVKQICLTNEDNSLNNVTAPSFMMDSLSLNDTTASDSSSHNESAKHKDKSTHYEPTSDSTARKKHQVNNHVTINVTSHVELDVSADNFSLHVSNDFSKTLVALDKAVNGKEATMNNNLGEETTVGGNKKHNASPRPFTQIPSKKSHNTQESELKPMDPTVGEVKKEDYDALSALNNNVFSIHEVDYRGKHAVVEIRKGVFILNLIPDWIRMEFAADENGLISQISHKLICSARDMEFGEYLLRRVPQLPEPLTVSGLVEHKSEPVYKFLTAITLQVQRICHFHNGKLNNDILTVQVMPHDKDIWAFIDINIKYPQYLNATDVSISKVISGEPKMSQIQEMFNNIENNEDLLLNFVKVLTKF